MVEHGDGHQKYWLASFEIVIKVIQGSTYSPEPPSKFDVSNHSFKV